MNPIILIPARMAAVRLPEKPLADIHGKPMIVHVWERAQASAVGKVYVACDDMRIKTAVIDAGGYAIMTSSEHRSGSDRIYEALCKIDPDENHDIIINLQGDLPTLSPHAIRAVLLPLQEEAFDIATLACAIKEEGERTDPSVVKAILSFPATRAMPSIARALYFTRATAPHGEGLLYHHIGIYAYRREALKQFVVLGQSPLEKQEKLEQLRALEAGMKIGVAVIDTVPLGVDTPEHLEKARQIIGNS